MAELMKENMRASLLAPVDYSFSSFLTKLPKIPAHVRKGAVAFRSSLDKGRSRRTLDRLALMGTSSGDEAFPAPCLIGTFHKTGTMLVWRIFEELAHYASFQFWNIGMDAEAPNDWRVGFEWWSDFKDHGLKVTAHPTAAIIRDPRNVLVSSMKFHRMSGEPWLHIPLDELDGRTYQQALLALPDDEARLHFELENQGGSTIADMLAAKRSASHAETLFMPLEDLMGDRTLRPYKLLFEHLGITEAYLPLAMSVAFEHSVFRPGFKKTSHITSGKAQVWKQAIPESVLAALDERYPDAAAELGYD
ncbi:hypothetical protein BPTFM16_01561 [Altererythrobacter insulae]|nr:hypothetical protein BPTFM16_01561 [Altererythrobacter insulae]